MEPGKGSWRRSRRRRRRRRRRSRSIAGDRYLFENPILMQKQPLPVRMKRFGMDSCTFAKYQKTLHPWFFSSQNERRRKNRINLVKVEVFEWVEKIRARDLFCLLEKRTCLWWTLSMFYFMCLLKLLAGEAAKSQLLHKYEKGQ